MLSGLRCDVCPRELTRNSQNEVFWAAREEGWRWTDGSERSTHDVVGALCPDHLDPASLPVGTFWFVGCRNCDWSTVQDWEEMSDLGLTMGDFPLTEESAKKIARWHDCGDYNRSNSERDTYIKSPEQHQEDMKVQAALNQKWADESQARRAREKEDQRRKEERERWNAELMADGRKYRELKYNLIIIISLVLWLMAMSYWAGHAGLLQVG